MHLHEYQAKKILKRYGVPVPPFGVASTPEEVKTVIDTLNTEKAVLKVQVHAGGRGKAGGVQFAANREETLRLASRMIGMKIINEQTGPEGITAHKVLIGPPCDIRKEYYCAVIMDRERKAPALIVSPEGGMNIEEIAEKMPERLLTIPLSFGGKLKNYHKLYIAKFMGWKGALAKEGTDLLENMGRAFWDSDASLVEINPLILTPEDQLLALDAKITVDDNALYRQEEIAGFYDPSQESPAEVAAKGFDLSYISLHGNIACMVNGAGLAMATMDIIHYYGGSPANFLYVG